MLNELKQFAEKVTGLRNNQFHLTRLKLTAIYAVLLLAILVISSIVTQSFFASRLERRFRDHPLMPPPPRIQINVETRQQVRQELINSLLLVNGTLFIGAVGLSYVLAGLTLKPIQDMYNKQRQFLGDASHELRTPLAILQTDLENELANPKLKESEKENLQSHLEEVKRMGSIVKDLLFISRLDNNEASQAYKENVDLGKLITEVVDRLKGYANAHKVELVISPIDNQKKITARANKEHLLQALSNVIKNGIDYNESGGKVTISLKQDQEQTTIYITDTGIGIDQDEIPKLFDRFYRVDQSRTREAGGSGLGLSIVQSILHTYDGKVAIESHPSKGTTVKISLPIHA